MKIWIHAASDNNDLFSEEDKEILRRASESGWSKMMTERTEDEIRNAGGYDKYIALEHKRSIECKSGEITDKLAAKNWLEHYDKDQIHYVAQCIEKITDAYTDYYLEDKRTDENDYPITSYVNDIKEEWRDDAYEEHGLSYEDFDDIFECLEILMD